ncbi:hypothetical protein ANO11243_084680 [Dothideomycetidae sp. 11243]|nr:hypothetical protein ANO11243_084680 [fungal sp. No.11243]
MRQRRLLLPNTVAGARAFPDSPQHIPKIMDFDLDGVGRGLFRLVQYRARPDGGKGLKQTLESQIFETDFIGSSVEDCQVWALEHQETLSGVEFDIIGIVDARFAIDGTTLMQRYARRAGRIDYGKYGHQLPREIGVWYSYRVHYKEALHILTAFVFTVEENTFPVYYGLKEDLTDEDGLFDVDKAESLTEGKFPDVYDFHGEGNDAGNKVVSQKWQWWNQI